MDVIIREEVRGWVIFGVNTNRPFSRLKANNELETIYYPTSQLAKTEAIRLDYKIIGYQKWD